MKREPHVAPASLQRPQTELYCEQVAAISSWHARRHAEEASARAVRSAAVSREQRRVLAQRMDVLRRQHDALIRRTHEQLCESVDLLRASTPARAVLASTDTWFRRALTAALAGNGVTVVAALVSGPELVGVTVAEQPDAVLIAGALPIMSSEQVIDDVRLFARRAVVAAQAGTDLDVALLLDAGADIAFTGRVWPAELADELSRLMAGVRRPGLPRPRIPTNH